VFLDGMCAPPMVRGVTIDSNIDAVGQDLLDVCGKDECVLLWELLACIGTDRVVVCFGDTVGSLVHCTVTAY
jgi:hypothetical protein